MPSDELRNSFYFIFEIAADFAEMATKAGSDIHNSSIVNRHSLFDTCPPLEDADVRCSNSRSLIGVPPLA